MEARKIDKEREECPGWWWISFKSSSYGLTNILASVWLWLTPNIWSRKGHSPHFLWSLLHSFCSHTAFLELQSEMEILVSIIHLYFHKINVIVEGPIMIH